MVNQNIGEVELRPSAYSMLFNKPSIKSNVISNRPLEPVQAPPKQISTPLLKESLPIKQMPVEKTKQTKKDKVIDSLIYLLHVN